MILEPHKWTNGGDEVLIVRCVTKEGLGYSGKDRSGNYINFEWPLTVGAMVEAPDWCPDAECGGGLHGWPWGLGIGDGKDPDWSGIWLVFGSLPKDVIGNVGDGQKCKAKYGTIRFVGNWQDATNFVLSGQIALIQKTASGAASATGWRGAASATGQSGAASATGWSGAASATGWSGAASATGASGAASATGESGAASATGESGAASATGWSGAASATGWSGAASATGASGAASATGWSGAASATGESGAASATGWSGAASATGESGAAVVTGVKGKAQAGPYGCIALAWWNTVKQRAEMRCAEIGCGDGSDKKLKANTWYQLDDSGRFVEVTR